MKSLTIRIPEEVFDVYTAKATEINARNVRRKGIHKKASAYSLIQANTIKMAHLLDPKLEEVSDEEEAERLANDGLAIAGRRAEGRPVSDVFVVRQDPYRHQAPSYYLKHISEDRVKFEYLPIKILESFLNLVLTSARKERLRNYSQSCGFSGKSLALGLLNLIDNIVLKDTIAEEIRGEFTAMETEVSASEAFNRGIR